MRESLLFLIRTLSHLYLLLFLLRFIMQLVRADFYNPLAQFIVKATNPLVAPARKVIPATARFDLPTLVVLILIQVVVTWLLLYFASFPVTSSEFAELVLIRLVRITLSLYFWAILAYIVLSWVSRGSRHPLTTLLAELTDPVLRQVRRILPPIAGIDLSPMLALILIQALTFMFDLPFALR